MRRVRLPDGNRSAGPLFHHGGFNDRLQGIAAAADHRSLVYPCPEGKIAGIAPVAVPDVIIAIGHDFHDVPRFNLISSDGRMVLDESYIYVTMI
jgi:hypothetical protein